MKQDKSMIASLSISIEPFSTTFFKYFILASYKIVNMLSVKSHVHDGDAKKKSSVSTTYSPIFQISSCP